MCSRLPLVAVAFLAVLVVENSAQAATDGPFTDFRDVVLGQPTNPTDFTITINTKFGKIRDQIIITIPDSWLTSRAVGGLSYVTPVSSDPTMVDITTLYGQDTNSPTNPMTITGFPSSFPANVFSGEQFIDTGGTAYPGTPIGGGPMLVSELPSMFPGYDLSPFLGGDPSSVVYAFSTVVPAAAVPEPASLGLLSAGVLLAAMRRRHAAGGWRQPCQVVPV
ncbi:MAG: PEP-CTERM sorting domain-containing protein [Tepidisphaeraceae bacterium]|jgi:hypothetical protein